MKVRSLLAAFGGATIVLCLVGWLDQPVDPSAAPTRPALSVTLDNARTSARSGDVVTYTTEVRNEDPVSRRLVVTQLLPSAYDVISATPGGRTDAGRMVWNTSLRPGESLVLKTKGLIGESKEGFQQLAASSCVGLPSDPMTACASDADPLAMANSPSGARALLIGGLIVGAVIVGAVGLIRLLERRSPNGRAAVWVGVPAEPAVAGPQASQGSPDLESAGSADASGSAASGSSPGSGGTRRGGARPRHRAGAKPRGTRPGGGKSGSRSGTKSGSGSGKARPSNGRSAPVPAPRPAFDPEPVALSGLWPGEPGGPFVRPEWIRSQPAPWYAGVPDSPKVRELAEQLGLRAGFTETDPSGNARSPPGATA